MFCMRVPICFVDSLYGVQFVDMPVFSCFWVYWLIYIVCDFGYQEEAAEDGKDGAKVEDVEESWGVGRWCMSSLILCEKAFYDCF
jgi:Mg2+ and Co2+ transporter CorA